jgi:serine/threonine protein kinase
VALTEDGTVKVLDFGLAKASGKDAASGTPAPQGDSVTLSREGVALGTPTWMSPEQARVSKTDKRTDIWALGCVLFECLTGERPFGGDTLTDFLGAIVHADPDRGRLPPSTPPRWTWTATACGPATPRSCWTLNGRCATAIGATPTTSCPTAATWSSCARCSPR